MADDVKSLLLEIDASVELLRRNIKRGEGYVDNFAKNVDRRLDGVDRRFDQAGRGIGSIGKTLDTVRGKMDAYGASLKAAATAFVATQGVDIALRLIRSGLDYASALGEQADQLGVTTDALQEYRFAATQTGIEQGEMDQALAQLTRRLGDAAAGAKAPAEAFKKLGISIRDSEGKLISTGDAIPQIAEALQRVESPAQRAAILVDLFGKAGQKLEPLLKGGAASVDGLREAARKAGVVLSPQMIKNADDAADALSKVKFILQANIAGAVAKNSAAIVDLAKAFGELAGKIVNVVGAYKDFQKFVNLKAIDAAIPIFEAQGSLPGIIRDPKKTAADRAYVDALRVERDRLEADGSGRSRNFNSRARSSIKGSNFSGTGLENILGGTDFGAIQSQASNAFGSGKGLPDLRTFGALAETFSKPTKDVTKKLNEFSVELDRLNADLALARADVTGNREERAAAEKARIAADLAADRLRIQSDKDLSEAQKKQSVVVQEQIAAARAELVDKRLADDKLEEKRELDQKLLDLRRDQLDDEIRTLQAEADVATSRKDRLDIERRILEALQAEERAQQEILFAKLSAADAAVARANLERRQAAERAGLERDGRGPGAAYLEQLRIQAVNLNDELENVAVGGLQNLNDGLAQAIASGDSLGKVFDRVLDQILADLIRIALQQATLSIFGGGGGGLGSSLGGGLGSLGGLGALGGLGGGASGGGFFGGLFGSIGKLFGKRALGGPVSKGRTYLVGEQGQELFVPNVDGQIVSNSKLRNMSGGGGGVSLTINAPGATAETVAMIRRELANAAPQIAAAARNATVAEMSRQRLP